MPFIFLSGVTGKVYVPEKSRRAVRKHPCPDCFCCQLCGDDRCNVCRGFVSQPEKKRKKTQIRSTFGGKRQLPEK